MITPYQLLRPTPDKIESPSLRDAYSQIGSGIDRALDWTYEHHQTILSGIGSALVVGGIGSLVMSVGMEPGKSQSLLMAAGGCAGLTGLSLKEVVSMERGFALRKTRVN